MCVCVCVSFAQVRLCSYHLGEVRRYALWHMIRSPVVCAGSPVMWSCVVTATFLLCKTGLSGDSPVINPRRAHAQRGLRYLVCPSVCLSVCSTLTLDLQATRRFISSTN